MKRESERKCDISTDDYEKGESANISEQGGNNHKTDLHAEQGLSDPEPDREQQTGGFLAKYGLMRRNFLKERKRGTYSGMMLEGKLKGYSLMVQEQAEERMNLLTSQMAKSQGMNGTLKASDQMEYVGLMNNIRASTEEMVLSGLIYS